jgi:hypothetical protein
MFETVLSLQPRVSSGSGPSREDVIELSAKDIFSKCPKAFDLDMIKVKYPTKYEDSMNTVLSQVSGNIRRTVRAHLGNIRPTFRAHLENIGPGYDQGQVSHQIRRFHEHRAQPGEWEQTLNPNPKSLNPKPDPFEVVEDFLI